jgi:acyl carrier protein
VSYLETVREYVIEDFLFGDASQLQEDTSFLESGIIDSTGILELINFIEEKYNIRVDEEDLVPENFDSLKNIVQYLEQAIIKSAANN